MRTLFFALIALAMPAQDFVFHNSTATPVTFKGKKGIKLTVSPDAPKPSGAGEAGRIDVLALAAGSDFSNGTIEVDVAGEPGSGAAAAGGARGFVGVAFRVQPDKRTYDAFYVRPTNGRADDQERRNHSVQYISHPEHTWAKLRKETPSKYESYCDIQPAEWIHLKVEVDGVKARLYVNGATQPTLLVNDLKSGAGAKGAVALWIEGSTVAHFANLKISAR